jgi:hypothetical protein
MRHKYFIKTGANTFLFQVFCSSIPTMTIHDNMPLSQRNSALILDDEKGISKTHPITIGNYSGILLDMDGTLIDSTNAIVKFWTR